MKDLIEKIPNYLPQYLTDFGSVFSSPKRFMAQKNTNADETLGQSLLFLGISLVLVVVMTAPLLPPGKDRSSYLAASAVTYLLVLCLTAAALRIAWRLVGGKATTRRFFVTYAYFLGVVMVILSFFRTLGIGVVKVIDPELYARVLDAQSKNQPIPGPSDGSVASIFVVIFAVGVLFASIWSLIAWGAYRQLNGLSKARSFIAFLVMGIFSCLIAAAVYFVGSAVM